MPISRLVGIIVLALSLLGAPAVVAAQSPAKVPRIGFLMTPSFGSPEARAGLAALQQGLREHGYVDGQNIIIEFRGADGRIDRFPSLVAELIRLKPDVIVAAPTPAGRAAQQATSTIPIVVPVMGDPVGDGLVASLARPGGNVTGLTFLGPELVGKRLEQVKDVLPGASRVAALWHRAAFSESTTREMLKATEAAARSLALKLQMVEVKGPDQLESAFSAMRVQGAEAVIVFPGSMFFSQRRRIVELANQHRLPSFANSREFVELGGLFAYGANIDDLLRRSATYVDKILKGAKPADLPVEQASKFEMVVNLRTAKALGLTVPPSVLLRADHVIQ